MKYDSDIFSSQYPIVGSFVQHLAYYRAGKPVYDRLGRESPFWCATLDAHLKIAVIQWCKVFGSDGCNATHWRKTPHLDLEAAKKSFMSKLIRPGLSFADWQKYHRSMLDFRNKFVAHHEIGFVDPVPNFDVALDVAYVYDGWIREVIRPDVYAGPLLRQHFADWKNTLTPFIEVAMQATHGLKE